MKLQSITPRACAVLFALSFAAFAGAPVFGQATTMTTNEDIPFTSSIFNQCNGDSVAFFNSRCETALPGSEVWRGAPNGARA